MRCNRCGQNNFEGARQCESCHAPLGAEAASPAPRAAERIELNSADEPLRLRPEDEERARRDRFVHTLYAATPHTFVTWSLIALNVAVFVLMVLRGASIGQIDLDTSLRWGASYAPLVTQGEWWRLLSATFEHGGILHLAANMYVLFAIGPVTERLYGNAAYAVLYLLAGLAGSLASVYWHPLVPSVGASGAVFGVMGGVLAFAARQRHSLPPTVQRSIASSVGQAVAINLVLGFATPHVDMAAHIGGLLGGFVFGVALARPIDAPPAWKHRRAAAVAVAGVVLVVVAARQLPRYDDWLGAVARLTRVEKESIAQFNTLMRDTRTDQKVRDEAARTFTDQTLARWTATRQEIARLRLPKAEREEASRLTRFMALRGESWRLYAEGYRTGDLRFVQEGRDKSLAADAMKTGRPPAIPKNDPLDALVVEQQAQIAWQQRLQRMSQADVKAQTAYNDGWKRLDAKKITPTQFADIVEAQVIPAARDAIDAVSQPPAIAAAEAQQQLLAEYTRLRLESWTLAARGIRADSQQLFDEAKKKQLQAANVRKRAEAPAAPKAP